MKQPQPSGRYCYDISSDESDIDAGERMHTGHISWNTIYTDESSESDAEEDMQRPSRRDVVEIRLANELDPWDKWEQMCRRRAWHAVQHRGKAETTTTAATPAAESSVDEIQELLSRFQLHQLSVQKKEREAFEQRNASLWEGIDRAIRDA